MWLIWAMIAAGTYGILLVVQKMVSVNSKNFRVGSIAFNLISTFLAIGLFLANGSYKNIIWPGPGKAYVFLVIGVLAYGLFERLRLKASSMVDASEYAILGNFSILVAFIISLQLYQESLSIPKVLGTMLIICAIILVSWRRNSKYFKKGIWWVLLTQFLVGVAMGVDKMGARFFQADLYNILVWPLPLIIIYFPSVKKSELIYEFKAGNWKILLMAFLNVFGYYASLKAFLLADATRVIPIMQTSVFVAVGLGIIGLKERSLLGRKVAGMMIAVAGAYLLTV